VVQTLQNKNANHRFGRVRRTSALQTHWTGRHPINLHHQGSKVNVRLNINQWIIQRVDFLAVMFVGEQIELDGSSAGEEWVSGQRNFIKSIKSAASRGFSRQPSEFLFHFNNDLLILFIAYS